MAFVYKKDLKDYYEGVIKGTLGSTGKLVRQQFHKKRGIEFIEFETDKENEPNYIFVCSYYINKLLIVQQYRTYKAVSKKSKASKDKFFHSPKFTNKHKPLQQGLISGERILYLVTYYATFVVIIGGFLALIGYIIYCVTTKKNVQNQRIVVLLLFDEISFFIPDNIFELRKTIEFKLRYNTNSFPHTRNFSKFCTAIGHNNHFK